MSNAVGLITFVAGGLAFFKVTFEIAIAWRKRDPKDGVPWREITGGLVVVAATAAVCVGLFVLLDHLVAPPQSAPQAQEAQAPPRQEQHAHEEQAPPHSCKNLDVGQRVQKKFPRCAEYAFRDTMGKCEYENGVIGAGTWSMDRDLEFYCATLALAYEPG